MKSKEPGMFLCRALVSLIVVLMIGFVGLGVRAFATADATQFIFSAAFVISVAILVLYFMLRRPIRELLAHSLFREPPFLTTLPPSALKHNSWESSHLESSV
jgi:ABC-type Na+ efflux pump permease subunit